MNMNRRQGSFVHIRTALAPSISNNNKLSLLVFCLILLAYFCCQCRVSLANTNNHDEIPENVVKPPFTGLTDWSTYTKLYHKSYSSITQQLVRQKLYLTKVMLVFIMAAKYRAKRSSHYLAINRWSDLTPLEELEKLSGEIVNSVPGEQQTIDEDIDGKLLEDDEIRKIIKDAILTTYHSTAAKDIATAVGKQQQQHHNRRRKRSATETELIHGPDNHEFVDNNHNNSTSRQIDLTDLVRLPGQPGKQAQVDIVEPATPIISMIAPSNNPDYVPVDGISFGQNDPDKAKPLEDIPEEQAATITNSTKQYNPATVTGFIRRIVGSISTSAWFGSQDFNDDNEKKVKDDDADDGKEKEEKEQEQAEEKIDRLLLDWRQTGCIAPPVNQGDCASCYAISSMSFIEWAFCMHQNKTLTPISAQYLVSCGPQFRQETGNKYQFYGCDRGRTAHSMHFIKDYGVELEANIPYLAEDTGCPIDEGTPLKFKGYLRPNVRPPVRMFPHTTQLDKALNLSPILVSFTMTENFLSFAGGMIDHCSKDNSLGGHAMLVVGKGITENDEPYLLIKNSFGPEWGDGGYFKLKRSALNECVNEFIWPRVGFPSKKSIARRARAHEARFANTE